MFDDILPVVIVNFGGGKRLKEIKIFIDKLNDITRHFFLEILSISDLTSRIGECVVFDREPTNEPCKRNKDPFALFNAQMFVAPFPVQQWFRMERDIRQISNIEALWAIGPERGA